MVFVFRQAQSVRQHARLAVRVNDRQLMQALNVSQAFHDYGDVDAAPFSPSESERDRTALKRIIPSHEDLL